MPKITYVTLSSYIIDVDNFALFAIALARCACNVNMAADAIFALAVVPYDIYPAGMRIRYSHSLSSSRHDTSFFAVLPRFFQEGGYVMIFSVKTYNKTTTINTFRQSEAILSQLYRYGLSLHASLQVSIIPAA